MQIPGMLDILIKPLKTLLPTATPKGNNWSGVLGARPRLMPIVLVVNWLVDLILSIQSRDTAFR